MEKEELDESLLVHILSLGWEFREELAEKILQSEASVEKSLYHHLKQRRSKRLEELRRLSPVRRGTGTGTGSLSSHRISRRTLFNPTTKGT